jgi:hypothetical protein
MTFASTQVFLFDQERTQPGLRGCKTSFLYRQNRMRPQQLDIGNSWLQSLKQQDPLLFHARCGIEVHGCGP